VYRFGDREERSGNAEKAPGEDVARVVHTQQAGLAVRFLTGLFGVDGGF